MEYNIKYNIMDKYDIDNKNPEEFMDWIKGELYKDF